MEEVRSFLSELKFVNERFAWCCAEAQESLEVLSAKAGVQPCPMDQLEEFLNAASRQFRAEIDTSINLPRPLKKERRRKARRDLAGVLVAVRLLAAAERNSTRTDELLGTAQELLRR
jgi:predicted ATPase with chaperone activity